MMVIVMRCVTFLLLSLVAVKTEIITNPLYGDTGSLTEEELTQLLQYMPNEEYIRHVRSMINSYRNDRQGGRMVIETNAMIDTKYKTWKRNADLINSLLALPKGMNDAGR